MYLICSPYHATLCHNKTTGPQSAISILMLLRCRLIWHTAWRPQSQINLRLSVFSVTVTLYLVQLTQRAPLGDRKIAGRLAAEVATQATCFSYWRPDHLSTCQYCVGLATCMLTAAQRRVASFTMTTALTHARTLASINNIIARGRCKCGPFFLLPPLLLWSTEQFLNGTSACDSVP